MLQGFLNELESGGVKPGEYHTPDWEETPKGLVKLLESLFQVTPPTALICTDQITTSATLAFLTRRGTDIPREVSVVSLLETDLSLEWLFPGIRVAQPLCSDVPFLRRIRE
ncbi:MAG: substrate-binding domain-containing protein [Luteolibacter sp.]